MEISRREVLAYFAKDSACLAFGELVGPNNLVFGQEAAGSTIPEEYRSWEDLFRRKWTWDKVVNGTHQVGCTARCEWSIFVKDGVAIREEQVEHLRMPNPELPDPGPQGCLRGACFTNAMYGPDRIKYPLKRVGKRGEGKWMRVSWDEALTEAADAIIDAIVKDGGPHSIVVDKGDETEFTWRYFYKSLGLVHSDTPTTTGDHHMGFYMTFGTFGLPDETNVFQSDLIFIWHRNPLYTYIPYFKEWTQARYRGAEIVTIAPDFSPSALHADYWIPVEPGTDAALALGFCNVIVEEKLYKPGYLKEQTDLPFLVREDTEKFLRQSEVEAGTVKVALPGQASFDAFYIYDLNARRVVKARRDTLELGSVDPALEGSYEVQLANGSKVKVRPVFERLKEVLQQYTPEAVAQIVSKPFAKVHPDVIREIARKAAKVKSVQITVGQNVSKCYHVDLIERSMGLFLVLSGHARSGGAAKNGMVGTFLGFGDVRSAIWEIPSFMEKGGVEGGIEAWKKRCAPVAEIMKTDPSMTEGEAWRIHEKKQGWCDFFVPGWQWAYYRLGFKERFNNKAWHDPSYKDFQSYVDRANSKGWWDGFIGPDREKVPLKDRVLISAGANYMRRMVGSSVIHGQYTPSLEKIIKIDFRMGASTLYADLVLPACGWYERIKVRRNQGWLMDKAVEPVGESKAEWSIACLLFKKISERARKRGIGKIRNDRTGKILELDKLYDKYTVHGAYKEGQEEKLADDMYKIAAALGFLPKGTTLETVRKNKGLVQQTESLEMLAEIGVPQVKDPAKLPHPTLTRRIQFYIDHEFYVEAGEALPVHKPHPFLGGDYPFYQAGGHGRESVHSTWITNPIILKLTRGVPSLFMNKQVAESMGIEDFEEVEVYNDAGAYRVRVKHSSLARPNQVGIYHCWEPYQFSQGHWQAVNPCVAKPLLLAGDYGHLMYVANLWQPVAARRGARVNIRKINAST